MYNKKSKRGFYMKVFRHSRLIVLSLTIMGICFFLSGCGTVKDGSGMLLALVSGSDRDSAALSGVGDLDIMSSYMDELYPPYWLGWTTDGSSPIECAGRYLSGGFRCSGRYCDDVNLYCRSQGFNQATSWWTDYFSEEDPGGRVCDGNGFVTGIRCTGRYCDNMSLRCSQPDNGGIRRECFWTSYLSEENGGTFVAPEATYIAGMKCGGRYCDNVQFYLCRADDGAVPSDFSALAAQFAPRLRFDQLFGTDSGDQSKCFPGDAGAYFTQRALGVQPVALCNQNYSTIANNQVPVYYIAKQIGTNTVVIRYFFFYAWQSTCFLNQGSHAADWESVAVMIVNGELKRVAFFQHGGWYSRNPGGFETVGGTHPVAYAGKNSHGSYHDSGGTGGCLYFEDFRNPGGNDYHMDTWNNLVLLERGSGAPAWMNCTGSACFDGIGHPLEREELGGFAGCDDDGCDKSQVAGDIPFIAAP